MNVGQLKKLIADLPDDVIVYQETGDHDLYEPWIDLSAVYDDEDYGRIECTFRHQKGSIPALIIR